LCRAHEQLSFKGKFDLTADTAPFAASALEQQVTLPAIAADAHFAGFKHSRCPQSSFSFVLATR